MTTSSKRVVYAFPHAGAGAGVYRNWLDKFGNSSDVRFIPVGIPGRDKLSREKMMDDLHTLVERLSSDIYTDYIRQRKEGITEFITFGHSFGGVLSFIVSDMLAKKYNITPVFSVISGSIAPSIQPKDDRHLWSDEKILSKMRSDNGTPERILNEPAIARRLVSALRTDYILRHQFLSYKSIRVEQPLVLISGNKDEHVTTLMQSAWQGHTKNIIDINEICGGHFAVYENVDIVHSLLARASFSHGEPLSAGA